MSKAVGPLLPELEVLGLLNASSRDSLKRSADEGKLLRLVDDDGQVRYPAWQFDLEQNRPYPVIEDLLKLCHEYHEDEWTLALFCGAPCIYLDGVRPADLLGDLDIARLLGALRKDLTPGH